MIDKIYSISELPSSPAVYAMYGGRGQGLYIAYVGVADELRVESPAPGHDGVVLLQLLQQHT